MAARLPNRSHAQPSTSSVFAAVKRASSGAISDTLGMALVSSSVTCTTLVPLCRRHWRSRFLENGAIREIAKAFAWLALFHEALQQRAQLIHDFVRFHDVLVKAVQARACFVAAEIK